MDCSFCGSQDTTRKTGIAKTGKNAGKPWVAYDCNESQCKNEKGYPNRTWAPVPKALKNASNAKIEASGGASNSSLLTIEKKLDMVLTILRREFHSEMPSELTTEHESEHTDESSPF